MIFGIHAGLHGRGGGDLPTLTVVNRGGAVHGQLIPHDLVGLHGEREGEGHLGAVLLQGVGGGIVVAALHEGVVREHLGRAVHQRGDSGVSGVLVAEVGTLERGLEQGGGVHGLGGVDEGGVVQTHLAVHGGHIKGVPSVGGESQGLQGAAAHGQIHHTLFHVGTDLHIHAFALQGIQQGLILGGELGSLTGHLGHGVQEGSQIHLQVHGRGHLKRVGGGAVHRALEREGASAKHGGGAVKLGADVPDALLELLVVRQILLHIGELMLSQRGVQKLLRIHDHSGLVVLIPAHRASEGLGGKADRHVGAPSGGVHIGGHIHGNGGAGPTLGEGGLGGTDGHGQGLAVADSCDGVALVADFGTHGLEHGAEGEEGAAVLRDGNGVGKGEGLSVELDSDTGGSGRDEHGVVFGR